MTSQILLDTHAAIWSSNGLLKPAAERNIDQAARRKELLLSPVSAWEIGMLVKKGRLLLTWPLEEWVRAMFAAPGVVTAAITPAIALNAAQLPGSPPRDPADRILIATAAAYGAAILTRDKAMLHYAKATGHVRCVAC
ncbi:MAG: type II toxin-antitoxin system VapC family toxin [Candidatus Eremiobacteraeota bacterium]|nr:type II toxin-antitoxin system VapC family toxin [Candidatus Eremiobacteraeota bacterium]MBV8434683.1 type II toxin-antitoxin system VapC family toxin [Candidatus Eremiobacteraeota bacterium]